MKRLVLAFILTNVVACGSSQKFNDPTPPVWYHKDFRSSESIENTSQFGLHKVNQICKPTASSLVTDCKHVYTLKLKIACRRDGPEFANIPESVRFRQVDVHVKLFYPNDGMNIIQRKGPTNHGGVWFASFEDSRFSDSQKVTVIIDGKEYPVSPDQNGTVVVTDPMCESKG